LARDLRHPKHFAFHCHVSHVSSAIASERERAHLGHRVASSPHPRGGLSSLFAGGLSSNRLHPSCYAVDAHSTATGWWHIVKEVITTNQDLLGDNKRVREGTISEKSGAYSRARKRLPIEMVEWFAGRVSETLIDQSASWFEDRRAFIIDGTTITLSPTSSLRDAYPPATNQFGETVWPVMMLMVAHELQSGCALRGDVRKQQYLGS